MSFYLDILLKDLTSGNLRSRIFAGRVQEALANVSADAWFWGIVCLIVIYMLKFVVFPRTKWVSFEEFLNDFLELLNDFFLDILLIFAPAISISISTKVSSHRLCFILITALIAAILCVICRNIYKSKSLSTYVSLWGLLLLLQGAITVAYILMIFNV